ncbi:MAG TPA: sensor histidine kinase [Vicinamibacterales bacterium]|nr:sensor histidine kinase [Vicinamibacterales bacterium]
MRGLTSRFVMLIAGAAVAPLVLYGAISIVNLRAGTEQSVRLGNLRVADEVAERIRQYIVNNERVLKSSGVELRTAGLEPWQQYRMVRDYVMDFPEFREVSVFTASGQLVATSRLGAPRLTIPQPGAPERDGVYIAPLRLDDDGLPTTTIAVRVGSGAREDYWIAGELALEELWRMVDSVRVGQEGYALLLGEDLQLIAHGDPDEKRHVAMAAGETAPAARTPEQSFAARLLEDPRERHTRYRDEDGRSVLAVAAMVPDLPWVVIVEQPTAEAFAVASALQLQLLAAIALALMGTVTIGWLWGRAFITRIFALTRATRAIADGRLGERVAVTGHDEIRQLGDSFNSMADHLVELQEEVRRQERQLMFGRIAAGLVHDLSNPVQTIQLHCKLITRTYDDPEYRETFDATIERETAHLRRVLDDLRNLAQPIPLERIPIDIDRTVNDVVEPMKVHAETAGVTVRAEPGAGGAHIRADVFALGRVLRNLIVNAVQATAPGGEVVVATEADSDRVRIRVSDTGCGIPPERLGAVFEDFVTTKRRGLGLGLAISKKIVEQLEGRISVTSEVGKGTTFVIDFPRTPARSLALAAG